MKTEIIKGLVKVANSLDQKGLYKESDLIDSLILKLASDSQSKSQKKYNELSLYFQKLENKANMGDYFEKALWDSTKQDLGAAGEGGGKDLRDKLDPEGLLTIKQWQDLCKKFGEYYEGMDEFTTFDNTNMFGDDEDPDTGDGKAWHDEDDDEDE